MKNLNLYLLGVVAILFSACSTNQDLTKLNEYDDIYYLGSPMVASATPVSTPGNTLPDASDAERSYYENAPYLEKETNEKDFQNTETEYYDESYANRIENFHRSNDADYMYSNSQNRSPSINYNFGYGMGTYGSGFNMGMSYGTPGFYGSSMYSSLYMSPWYSPYYSPFYSPYYSSFYSPYYSPFYSPYYARPYYAYGGYSPYYYSSYPYYGYGYYPPYYGGGIGGDYYGNNSGVTNVPRQNTGSVRPSRGGVITPNNNSGSGRNEIAPGTTNGSGTTTRATSENTRSEVITRPNETELRGKDVQTREALTREDRVSRTVNQNYGSTTRENIRPGTTRNDYIRSEQPMRQTRSTTPSQTSRGGISFPDRSATPSRTTGTSSPLSPATRSRADNINSNINRSPSGTISSPASRSRSIRSSSPQRMSPRQQSTPTRSYSTPSAPSRSSGGSFSGSGSGTSSPASTPSRGSRR